MHKKYLAAVAAVAIAGLTGCQSANDKVAEVKGGEITSYDTSAIKADPAVKALVPERVSADGKLTQGVNLYWAPAEFKDGDKPVGYEIDMMKAVAARMGLELDVQNAEFDSILPGIPGKYEVGVSALTVTAEREANFNMIQYYTVGTSWAVQKDNPDNFNPTNICGKSIGVQTGTTQDDEVAAAAKLCTTQPDIQRYDAQESVTQALVGGKIQAMAADSSVIEYAVKQTGDKLQLTGDITGTAPQAAVVPKDDAEMTAAVKAALQSLMDDGTLAKIFAHWGITENVATEAIVNPAV